MSKARIKYLVNFREWLLTAPRDHVEVYMALMQIHMPFSDYIEMITQQINRLESYGNAPTIN